MAPRKGNMMTVRADVKVVDATIRDGGLCNNFEFTDEFVTELYKTNVKSGVDYMEFGYRASKNLFDVNKFGKWKFCDEADIRSIVGENISDMKIAVMADVGRCDFKEDFVPKSESVIDMVRVACYIHQIPAALEMIEYFHNLGYETTCNIMAISQASSEQIEEALAMIGQSSVDVIYLVDSYGSLYPETAGALAKNILKSAKNTVRQSAFMRTTIKILLLQTRLKLFLTVFLILMPRRQAWEGERATAQWSFCSDSLKIRNIIFTVCLPSLKIT